MQIKLSMCLTHCAQEIPPLTCPILLFGRKPFQMDALHSAPKFPPIPCCKEWAPPGLSFSSCNWGMFIPTRTGELPALWVSFNVINVNAALFDCTLSFRWIFYPFVTKAFQKIKYTFYCMKYMKSSVKYDNVTPHAVLLGMISRKCFSLTVSYNGWKYSLSLHTQCEVWGILLESGNLPLKYWYLKSKLKA